MKLGFISEYKTETLSYWNVKVMKNNYKKNIF